MISILPGSQKSQKSEKGQGRELSKLKRQDLLELLLDQMHESDDLRAALAEQRAQILELTNLAERLKDKLDLKDEQIEHLKEKLNLKDEQRDHLTAKLDDKDALIARLKKRLDIKDAMIADLMSQGRELETSGDMFDMIELLETEERAMEACIERKAEAETEAAPESAHKGDAEPEPEAASEVASEPEEAVAPEVKAEEEDVPEGE